RRAGRAHPLLRPGPRFRPRDDREHRAAAPPGLEGAAPRGASGPLPGPGAGSAHRPEHPHHDRPRRRHPHGAEPLRPGRGRRPAQARLPAPQRPAARGRLGGRRGLLPAPAAGPFRLLICARPRRRPRPVLVCPDLVPSVAPRSRAAALQGSRRAQRPRPPAIRAVEGVGFRRARAYVVRQRTHLAPSPGPVSRLGSRPLRHRRGDRPVGAPDDRRPHGTRHPRTHPAPRRSTSSAVPAFRWRGGERMSVTLRSLETAVPATALRQETVRDVLAAQPDLSRLGKRLVSTAFDSSGIEHRYSALTEWGGSPDEGEPVFFEAGTGRFLNPTPGARNRVYEREATRLYTQVAREALAAADGIEAAGVTHVITVACPGFFAPGPDYRIVRDLDLDPSVQRYHLGFMGCYAALPALRQAQTICRADPEAVVIVASVELCTLHVRTSNDPDTIVGSSLFADGAAGAVITGKELPATSALLRIDHFETVL